MDFYDPATVFSAIDEFGRYAYANQPTIARWNLARFAETLLPIVDPNPERASELANEAISAFSSRFQEHWLAGMRDKLGISGRQDGDGDLVRGLPRARREMQRIHGDFPAALRDAAADGRLDAAVRTLFADPGAYEKLGRRMASASGPLTGANLMNAPRRCETSIPPLSRAPSRGMGARRGDRKA